MTATKFLAVIAKRLGDKPFLGGASVGYADLWVYAYVAFFTTGFFDHLPLDFVSRNSPAVHALCERIKASELIKAHGEPA